MYIWVLIISQPAGMSGKLPSLNVTLPKNRVEDFAIMSHEPIIKCRKCSKYIHKMQ